MRRNSNLLRALWHPQQSVLIFYPGEALLKNAKRRSLRPRGIFVRKAVRWRWQILHRNFRVIKIIDVKRGVPRTVAKSSSRMYIISIRIWQRPLPYLYHSG